MVTVFDVCVCVCLKQQCIALSRLSSLIYGSISKECLQRQRQQREAGGKSTKAAHLTQSKDSYGQNF